MNAIQQLLTDHLNIWIAADTEKKSGRGRASSNAGSAYGIKKLRELILELAVRGKLVPQDPNDEPASELLKRIQAEKAKLIAEGKIKKDKSLSTISDEEKPFVLPQGWAYSRLGDAVEIIRGITFPGSEKTKVPEKGRVACLRTTNVQDQIEWDDLLYIREEFVSREEQILMPRDIVMSMANSRELVGKVALVGAEIHQKTSFGGFLGVLRPFLIEPRFVMALLRTPHTREALIDSASQTTNIANISLAKLRPLFFAIPPLAEQQRIVAKVDELMALCDQLESQHNNAVEAHQKLVNHLLGTLTQAQSAAEFNANWQRLYAHFDVLFTTEASIDALKQTLLQLAVMGKLVPQDPHDEPASELLKRIQAEKAKLIADGKIKKDKPLASITKDEKPFELPTGWEWVRVLDCSVFVTDGEHATPQRTADGQIPLVTAKNVRDGYMDYEDTDFVDISVAEKCWKRCKPEQGDLLMVSVGATLGRLSMLHQAKDMVIVRSVTLIRPYLLNPMYLSAAVKSPLIQQAIWGSIRQMAQPGLYLAQSSSLVFPLPPLDEQQRIVAKLDALMALCDQLKARITAANQQQQLLADALVAQAVNPTAEIIDLASYRAAAACHAIKKMQGKPYFGRTALMKVLYLAEANIGLELELTPYREAAGPLDPWIYAFDRQGEQENWFKIIETPLSDGKTKAEYRAKSAIAQKSGLINKICSAEQLKEFDRLLALFSDKNTEEAEIIATLFAAWNDFLIDGHTPNDEQIVQEVRENWHQSKARFTPSELKKWLVWLRSNNLVPQGRLPRTVYQQQLLTN